MASTAVVLRQSNRRQSGPVCSGCFRPASSLQRKASQAFSPAKPGKRGVGVNSHSLTLPTWFSTWPFSQPDPGVQDRLKQIMACQGQEPAVESAFLADENGVNHGLKVTVNDPFRNAAKTSKCLNMRIQDQSLGFAGIGHQEHLSAIGQAKMRHLDRL